MSRNSKTLVIALILVAALPLRLWSENGRSPVPREVVPERVTMAQLAPEEEMEAWFRNFAARKQPTVCAAVVEKPEKEMTAEELAVKRALEKEVTKAFPTHRIVFDRDKTMTGWVVEEKPESVLFTESYGESGSLNMRINRSRIVKIEAIGGKVPPITYRDVRFKMEFPRFNFFKRPPYTLVTDESYFKVEYIVRALQILHSEFLGAFGPLISADLKRRQDIQVLSFAKHEDFRRYVGQDLGGQYRPDVDRLILFNQQNSDWAKQAKSQVQAEASRHSSTKDEEQARRLGEWRAGTENSIAWRGKLETLKTIRHEGAHQLSFSLGVLGLGVPMWLAEGLATYSETEHVGERNQGRITDLKASMGKDKNVPMEPAFNMREVSGRAYSRYWALTHFFIQSPMRSRFFDYMRHIRDDPNNAEDARAGELETICRFLNIPPDLLQKQWNSYVSRL